MRPDDKNEHKSCWNVAVFRKRVIMKEGRVSKKSTQNCLLKRNLKLESLLIL